MQHKKMDRAQWGRNCSHNTYLGFIEELRQEKKTAKHRKAFGRNKKMYICIC